MIAFIAFAALVAAFDYAIFAAINWAASRRERKRLEAIYAYYLKPRDFRPASDPSLQFRACPHCGQNCNRIA